MNFYYDTILGLQYDYIEDLIIVDLECLPEISVEEWLEKLKDISILPSTFLNCMQIIPEITNYKL
mgnify:CR=1 FL=1